MPAGVKSVAVLCAGSRTRLATLRALWVLEKLFAPIAARRALADDDGPTAGGAQAGGALGRMLQRKRSVGLTLRLRLRGEALKKMDLLSESDPLCVVKAEMPGGGVREVGRTRHFDNEPNPRWPPLECQIPQGVRRLKLQVLDYEGPLLPARLIGQATEDIDALLRAEGGPPLRLTTVAGKGGRGQLYASAVEVGGTGVPDEANRPSSPQRRVVGRTPKGRM